MKSKILKVLISGSDGQLGSSFKLYLKRKYFKNSNSNLNFIFLNKKDFDITKYKEIKKIIKKIQPDFLINAAAYTNVFEAEKRMTKKAYLINAYGVENLAKLSLEFKFKIIHISTELVYSGTSKFKKISEKNSKNPTTMYGKSKLLGEKMLRKYAKNYIILRVSWLYSLQSKNFLTFILNNIDKKNEFKMIYDAMSSPTSCNNLISIIMKILTTKKNIFIRNTIFNFCDQGKSVSPYDFTNYIIKEVKKYKKKVPILIKTDFKNYNKNIKKPRYLTLDNSKIINHLNFKASSWRFEIKKLIEDKYS